MESLTLPPIETFHTLPFHKQMRVLDLLFEPSPSMHSLLEDTISASTFSSYPSLIDHVRAAILGIADSSQDNSRTILHAILGSHPRLGAKKVESAQSAAEQARLQQGGGAHEAERSELAKLNDEYEATFPGLRYVVFVNGRGRPEIMDDMRARIAERDMRAEERTAIQAMCDIANDRAAKLLARSQSAT